MRIQLLITLVVATLLGTSISHRVVANPCAGISNPCAATANPCAGNNKFERKNKRDNPILHQSKAYYCDNGSYNYPTVVFRSDLGNIPVFEFRVETAPEWYENNKDYYNPTIRCNEIASRASEFHEMNLVSHLRIEEFNNTQSLCISNLDWPHKDLIAEDVDAARLVFTFIKPVEDQEYQDILSRIKGRTQLLQSDPIQI